jgi:hypothetical protein
MTEPHNRRPGDRQTGKPPAIALIVGGLLLVLVLLLVIGAVIG